MPLLPSAGLQQPGGLAMPQGAPQGLLPPVQSAPPPAAMAMLGLAPLAQQQVAQRQAMAAIDAQQTMARVMQVLQQAPSPAAEAAQSEPSPMPPSQPGPNDPTNGSGY